MTKKKQKLTGGHAVIIIVLILLALICFYPMWYTLIMSFSDKVYVDAGRTWLIPLGLNVKSYGKILKDSLFFSAMWVSVKRVIVGCAVSMFMLIITAYPLCVPEKKFPASKYIKWFFLANMMFSGGLIPFYTLMRQYHLFNSFWVLILPGALPLWNMILMMNFFRNVPYALNESATIDGANAWQTLWKVTIPNVMPSITICTFLTLTNSFKLFDQNLALTAGRPFIQNAGETVKTTEMLALNIYSSFYASTTNRGVGQAKAVIFFVLVAAISILQLSSSRKKEVQQ